MKNKIIGIISWLVSLWTSFIFLNSLIFKFNPTALEPKHIFTTIGAWMSITLSPTLGDVFANYGQYFVGFAELVTSIVLLILPLFFLKCRALIHSIGGIMAIMIMIGAIFFHIFTPLGWHVVWSVTNISQCSARFIAPNSCIDSNLADAAVTILVLNIIMVLINRKIVNDKC